jgi:hypothetical protein
MTTFDTKIAPQEIDDYLFFVPMADLAEEVRSQARQYFAQGREVNFLGVKDWILMSLATMGSKGRAIFNGQLMELLDAPEIPSSLKLAWNARVAELLTEPATH